MDNPFTWDYMTTPRDVDQVFDVFGIAFLVVFGLGFVASLVLYNHGAGRFTRHPIARRAIRRVTGIATGVFGAGLFFFGIRALQINPFTFGLPLWMWLSAAAALATAGYAVYYARTVYPAQRRAYEQHRLKQQYLRPRAADARAGASRKPPARAARPARRQR